MISFARRSRLRRVPAIFGSRLDQRSERLLPLYWDGAAQSMLNRG